MNMPDADVVNWALWLLPKYYVLTSFFLYTAAVEVFPKWVNGQNSNAATSQVRWNVGVPALNLQLMDYALYHTKFWAKFVHGATFLCDTPLWNLYFFHMLEDTKIWRYAFVFLICVFQALTYSDNAVKIYLSFVHFLYFIGGTILINVLFSTYDSLYIFHVAGICLIINAVLRVASHAPEDTPIHFFHLKDKLPGPPPLRNPQIWKRAFSSLKHFIQFLFVSTVIATLSELQAGFPIRLFGSALIMIRNSVVPYKTESVDIVKLVNTAEVIACRGFYEEQTKEEQEETEAYTKKRYKDYIYKWMMHMPLAVSFENFIVDNFTHETVLKQQGLKVDTGFASDKFNTTKDTNKTAGVGTPTAG